MQFPWSTFLKKIPEKLVADRLRSLWEIQSVTHAYTQQLLFT